MFHRVMAACCLIWMLAVTVFYTFIIINILMDGKEDADSCGFSDVRE